MSKRTTLIAVAVGILALVTVQAQQNAKGAPLSPMDYIQINQLINRYAYAVDTGAEQGGMYAGLFAPGGKFLQRGGVEHVGREALASVGYRNSRGPQSVFHYLMSHAIEPTRDGNARGKEQLVQLTIGDNGAPSTVFGGGHYDDIYERTTNGWRFKQRQFIPSQSGYELAVPTMPVPEQRRISTAPVTSTTMTASDYIEIQQLLARYPYALDTGQRKGQMWVDVFTKDATFNQSQGADALMKIAWQHRPGQGPSYDRNFPQSVVITPTAEGATGKALTYVIDIGEGQGKPSTILNGARYEDMYVRTPDGWRIKSRTVNPKKSGANVGAELRPPDGAGACGQGFRHERKAQRPRGRGLPGDSAAHHHLSDGTRYRRRRGLCLRRHLHVGRHVHGRHQHIPGTRAAEEVRLAASARPGSADGAQLQHQPVDRGVTRRRDRQGLRRGHGHRRGWPAAAPHRRGRPLRGRLREDQPGLAH
jgi:hypothetical protein